jgi:pilus assembly protein CpaB
LNAREVAAGWRLRQDFGHPQRRQARIVLTAIERNEPVLSSKVTGPGQRATLSAMLGEGLKAATVRVNDIDGVGGFVLPGDHVDVTLTRQVDKTNASTEVVLQNVRGLAIDQIADERIDKPAVVKAVTLEVDVIGRKSFRSRPQLAACR